MLAVALMGQKTVGKLFGLSMNQGMVRKLYYHCVYHCIPYSTHSETVSNIELRQNKQIVSNIKS